MSLIAQAAPAPGGSGFPAPYALIAALVLFVLAYRFYARWCAHRLFGTENDDRPTPATTMRDDVDFVPTSQGVLFGHHFTSVAGAAPIVGPAIAVMYGWLPPYLWIVLGVIFMGAMQDMGALAVSARNRGRSIGDLASGIISGRARTLFLLIVLFLAWIVLAVFAFIIATLLVDYPQSVVPINIQIIVAMIIGFVIYRMKAQLLWPSLGALLFLYVMIWGFADADPEKYRPSSWPVFSAQAQGMMAEAAEAVPAPDAQADAEALAAHEQRVAREEASARRSYDIQWWMVALLLYCFVASVLPVWMLLQPRDYINSHQLYVALGLIFAGFFVSWPSFAAPALNWERINDPASPPIFPFLFVTVACGAISGFHALIASGTTSKQLGSFRHVRPVGYGGMLLEGVVALLATLACAAGIDAITYHQHYMSFAHASSGLSAQLGIFVQGCSNLLGSIGVPAQLGALVVTVMVISFAATTLDSATRIMRYIISELGDAYGLRALTNRYVATGLAVGSSLLLAFSATGGRGGFALWPMFGSLNQLTAALALLVIAVYLHRVQRPKVYYVLPMLLVALITLVSMILQFRQFVFPPIAAMAPNYFLGTICGIVIILDVWLLLEGAAVLLRKPVPMAEDFAGAVPAAPAATATGAEA